MKRLGRIRRNLTPHPARSLRLKKALQHPQHRPMCRSIDVVYRRQFTICHTHVHMWLVYRRLIGGVGHAREAIYHPDEEKSITFQRHPSGPSPSSLSLSPAALAVRDLRASRYLTPLRHMNHVHYVWWVRQVI